MAVRDLVGGLILAGAAVYALRRLSGTTLAGAFSKGLPGLPLAPPPAPSGPTPYQAATARRESGGDPYAKNPRSSASGLYQFTRSTWVSLGGAWGSDSSKAFGGLRPSVAEQDARFQKFTAGNASGLQRAGLAATSAALYTAHFLGLGGALKVFTAAASTPLANVVGSKVMAANPQLQGFTIADFRSWAASRANG